MADSLDLESPFDLLPLSRWRERVEGDLGGRPAQSLDVELPGGFTIPALRVAPHAEPVRGEPGRAPFVRGATAERGWQAVRALPDDPEAAAAAIAESGGEAAEVGPALLAALSDPGAWSGVLDRAPGEVFVDAGRAQLAGAAHALRHPAARVRMDPLAVLAAGGLDAPLEAAYDDLADLVHWRPAVRGAVAPPEAEAVGAAEGTARPVLVDVRPVREAGASVVDELAYAVGAGVEALRALSARGHEPAAVASRMVFAFGVGPDVFPEVAKLRAARLLWARVLEACGVSGAGCGMWIHARSAERELTILEPKLNLLRGTATAFAAIVGGAQQITVLPFDAVCAEHSSLAARMARNTLLLLEHEGHLDQVIDPAGGSYVVEALTDELARGAWTAFQGVEAEGGLAAALIEGRLADSLRRAGEARGAAAATGRQPMVGVHRFGSVEPPVAPAPALAPWPPVASVEGPVVVRAALSGSPLGGRTSALLAWGASLGDMRGAVAHGRAPLTAEPLVAARLAAPFESVRAAVAALPPNRREVLILRFGDDKLGRARGEFSREVMTTGGFTVSLSPLYADAASAVLSDPPPTVVLAGPDDVDEEVVALASAARAAGVEVVLFAGRPPGSGIDLFVHRGRDLPDLVGELCRRLLGDQP